MNGFIVELRCLILYLQQIALLRLCSRTYSSSCLYDYPSRHHPSSLSLRFLVLLRAPPRTRSLVLRPFQLSIFAVGLLSVITSLSSLPFSLTSPCSQPVPLVPRPGSLAVVMSGTAGVLWPSRVRGMNGKCLSNRVYLSAQIKFPSTSPPHKSRAHDSDVTCA